MRILIINRIREPLLVKRATMNSQKEPMKSQRSLRDTVDVDFDAEIKQQATAKRCGCLFLCRFHVDGFVTAAKHTNASIALITLIAVRARFWDIVYGQFS